MKQENIEQRLYTRFKAAIVVTLDMDDGSRFAGTTIEVSMGGIIFHCGQQPKTFPNVGDRGIVTLNFDFDGSPATASFLCTIVHRSQHGCGITFREETSQSVSNMKAYILEKLITDGSDAGN